MTRQLRKIALTAGIAGFLIALAAPAGAHVEIQPSSAPASSDAVLTFAVPNEVDSATTTKVVVTFPAEHPIAEAAVEPVVGWTAKVDTTDSSTPIKTDSPERPGALGHSGARLPQSELITSASTALFAMRRNASDRKPADAIGLDCGLKDLGRNTANNLDRPT